jgi:hypothetical protein
MRELEILEYNNRWLYSLERKNLFAPGEKKLVEEFNEEKYDLYTILYKRTMESIFNKEINYKENDFKFIYLSLLRAHQNFYDSLNPTLRKKILTTLP